MTKKILSLALSVVLVMGLLPTMGLFPAMSVSAAGGTSLMTDDFENYAIGKYTNTTLSVNGTETWKFGADAVGEIETMTGYDGKSTKVLKISTDDITGGSVTAGAARTNAVPLNDDANTTKLLPGKIYVQESKIYVPTNVMTEDGTAVADRKRPGTFNFGYGVYVDGNDIYVSRNNNEAANTGVTMPSGKWVDFKVVFDYTDYTTANKIVYYTMYMDDRCIAKGTDATSAYIIAPSRSLSISTINQKGTDPAGTYDDIYFAVDDVKFYHSPAATTASSYLNGNDSVSATTSPTVNFTERVLEYAGHADGVISAANNIDFEKSDGTKVEIEKLTLSADGKTLTIDPEADLEKDTQYTVTVKNLHDMYGQDIATYTFSFTTADEASVEYTKEPTFTNEQLLTPGGSTTPITKLETGYINTSFTVKNTHASKSQDVIALVFLKDNGEIKQFQFEKGNLAANGGEITFNGGFFVNVEQFVNPTIEVFVWDSLYGGMTPLVPKHTLTTTAIVK